MPRSRSPGIVFRLAVAGDAFALVNEDQIFVRRKNRLGIGSAKCRLAKFRSASRKEDRGEQEISLPSPTA